MSKIVPPKVAEGVIDIGEYLRPADEMRMYPGDYRNEGCCDPGPCPPDGDDVVEFAPKPPPLDPYEVFYESGRTAIDFSLPEDNDNLYQYFNPSTGAVQTENISNVGFVSINEKSDFFNNDAGKAALEEARGTRISEFHNVMDTIVSTSEDTMHNYDGEDSALLLEDGDRILTVVDCTEITGVPTGTNMANIVGSIKVGIVERANPDGSFGHHVHFSIGKGTYDVTYDEDFSFNMDSKSWDCAACWGICGKGPNKRGCLPFGGDAAADASYYMDYVADVTRSEQYVVLPIADTVLSAHTWREAIGSLRATSSADGYAAAEKGSCCKNCCQGFSCSCCSWACCSCCWFNLKLYRYCFPECCFRCYQAEATERIMYHGVDSFELGHRLGDDVSATKTINDNYKWQIYKTKTDEISVTMHYVHVLDGQVKTCNMKLRTELGEDTDLVYKSAQKFVSMISKYRTKMAPPRTCCGLYTYTPGHTFSIVPPTKTYRPLFYTEADRKIYQMQKQIAAEASMKYGWAGDALNLVKPVVRPVLDLLGVGDIEVPIDIDVSGMVVEE